MTLDPATVTGHCALWTRAADHRPTGLKAARLPGETQGQGRRSGASVDSIPKFQPKGGSASQRERMGACCPLSPSSEPSGGLFRYCFSNLGPGPCLTTKDYWGNFKSFKELLFVWGFKSFCSSGVLFVNVYCQKLKRGSFLLPFS